MDDKEFIRAFEEVSLPGEAFHHRDHVRLAWLYLRGSDSAAAAERMAHGVRRFAAAKGSPEKYHHTLTLAWMRLVAAALRSSPQAGFEAFLVEHPALLDKQTPLAYYSPARLEAGRDGWVEPDLHPLP